MEEERKIKKQKLLNEYTLESKYGERFLDFLAMRHGVPYVEKYLKELKECEIKYKCAIPDMKRPTPCTDYALGFDIFVIEDVTIPPLSESWRSKILREGLIILKSTSELCYQNYRHRFIVYFR